MRQNIILLAVLSVAIVGLTSAPALADQTSDLLAKIALLEKQVADKDAVLMEQVKVILLLKDNYEPHYPDFSLEKYPQTGGFPTEWLQGERAEIIKTCQEARAMGYENPYCKYVS